MPNPEANPKASPSTNHRTVDPSVLNQAALRQAASDPGLHNHVGLPQPFVDATPAPRPSPSALATAASVLATSQPILVRPGAGVPAAAPVIAPGAARCTGSDLLRWMGLAHEAGPNSDAIVFPMRRVRAGTLVVHEGAPFESLYFVNAGSFKNVHTDPDGYELVQGFLSRGDVIGLDGLCDGSYGGDAVALEDATVAIVAFRELLAAGRAVPALEQLLFLASGREIRRKNLTLEVMAAVGAEVRLARFLTQLIERQAEQGFSRRCMVLRMSRRDIASHLGIAHETVSRSLTALADWGYIAVRHREIEILDPEGLDRFKRVTRGPAIRPPGGRGGASRRARAESLAAG